VLRVAGMNAAFAGQVSSGIVERIEDAMRNRIFHQRTIAGMTFEGLISADGPYLSGPTQGGVALGPAGLRYFQPASHSARHTPSLGWWVVKYYGEERIFLPGFDRTAVRDLSSEFGVPVLGEHAPEYSARVRHEYFFTSPAWDALRQWVTRHPRIAKANAACDSYLPRWYDRAMIEANAVSFDDTERPGAAP